MVVSKCLAHTEASSKHLLSDIMKASVSHDNLELPCYCFCSSDRLLISLGHWHNLCNYDLGWYGEGFVSPVVPGRG